LVVHYSSENFYLFLDSLRGLVGYFNGRDCIRDVKSSSPAFDDCHREDFLLWSLTSSVAKDLISLSSAFDDRHRDDFLLWSLTSSVTLRDALETFDRGVR
jgi:hypothetical protein